jgi:hypothetical protein
LRDGVMRLGACLGLIGGAWWGFRHPAPVSRCSTHGPANAILAHCTGHTFTTVALHWAVTLGVGFAVGGLIGVAVASPILGPTRA